MSEKKRYTVDELMPKRYPENRPTNHVLYDEYWTIECSGDVDWHYYRVNGDTSFDSFGVMWFLDIPGAPEEVRPRKYPDEKPERVGDYVVHVKAWRNDYESLPDEWTTLRWIGDDWNGCRARVDYFINIPLEEEMEEKIWDTDSLGASVSGGQTTMWDGVSAINIVNTELTSFCALWLSTHGYDITKRAPEIAPCPNTECGDIPELVQTSGNDDGKNFYLYCNSCGYCSPCGYDENDAVRLHNLIAGKSSKC